MASQNFVGTKPVDEFPAEVTQKIPDEELTKREAQRDSNAQPGANKRAGVATREPDAQDSKGPAGSFGNAQPVQDPVL